MGFADDVWGSRAARPSLHAWSDGGPPRLTEVAVPRDDPDPKAIACYGLLGHQGDAATAAAAMQENVWVRFVDGRPVSVLTIQLLAWCAETLAAQGRTTLLVVWDNAA